MLRNVPFQCVPNNPCEGDPFLVRHRLDNAMRFNGDTDRHPHRRYFIRGSSGRFILSNHVVTDLCITLMQTDAKRNYRRGPGDELPLLPSGAC